MGKKKLGQCFDKTAIYFLERGSLGDIDIIVCHGIVDAKKPGLEGVTGHAWVERYDEDKQKWTAIDPTGKFFAEKNHYRSSLNARNIIEYKPKEYLYLQWINGNSGPWDEEIKKVTA